MYVENPIGRVAHVLAGEVLAQFIVMPYFGGDLTPFRNEGEGEGSVGEDEESSNRSSLN